MGHPNEGHLEGGVRLDTKLPYVRVVPAYDSGDVRWGLPALVHMLERAAKTVAKKFPGSVLDVGDLSRRGGGDVLRHHSHESGRDADVGFYAVDAKGKQVHASTFIKFESGLASSSVKGAHLDLARTWAFVQVLLTDPAARTTHVFIAEPLRHELLAYAKAHGASRSLLDRAAVVMMQPTTSLPHDDHMHVRVSCPHGGRSNCIELAKNAPLGALARRGAHGDARGGRHGSPTLRSGPGGGGKVAAGSARHDAKDTKDAPRTRSIAHDKAGAASHAARDVAGAGRGASPGRSKAEPAASKPARPAWADGLSGVVTQDDEGAADAAEVRDALDDLGLFKITE